MFFSALALLAQTKTPVPASVPEFEDISRQVGLTASRISTPEQHYIIESMSGGIALFDCDDGGKLDIAMVNGSTVDRYRAGGDPLVTLYRQDSDLKFADITQSAGLTRKGWSMGIAVAGFDNDGKLDIFVTGFGGSALYRGSGSKALALMASLMPSKTICLIGYALDSYSLHNSVPVICRHFL